MFSVQWHPVMLLGASNWYNNSARSQSLIWPMWFILLPTVCIRHIHWPILGAACYTNQTPTCSIELLQSLDRKAVPVSHPYSNKIYSTVFLSFKWTGGVEERNSLRYGDSFFIVPTETMSSFLVATASNAENWASVSNSEEICWPGRCAWEESKFCVLPISQLHS